MPIAIVTVAVVMVVQLVVLQWNRIVQCRTVAGLAIPDWLAILTVELPYPNNRTGERYDRSSYTFQYLHCSELLLQLVPVLLLVVQS